MPQLPHVERGPNTLRILVTTDNHVGYNESDPVRGDDSWRTFEEIMNVAKEQDVDMVLQSGDLFHINKPTKKSMYHVMRTLRRTCFGDKPCELEMLSDPSQVFDDGINSVNYEDPNLNISIPVFAISGNHDDASGSGLLSPLDILNVSGMVNHFGRVIQTDQIDITPILLQKGTTKLALYGMASVRDERLFKSFQDKRVKFQRPNVLQDEWFNLMAVHQNHVRRPNTAYLPEHFLPSFLDLVIWGHEHECIPHTVYNANAQFETLQPGSSVATSLSDGEAIEKRVFVININNRDYSLESFKLKTVRPFQMLELSLPTIRELRPGLAYKTEVTQYLISKVEDLIEKSKEDWEAENPDMEPDQMPLPLIRLRVDYSGGYEVENPRRFSNRFVGRVANANTIVQFHKKNDNIASMAKRKNKYVPAVGEDMAESANIETFISDYLKEMELSLLPEKGMNDAIKKFVEKEDKFALKEYVDLELEYEEKGFLENENIDLEDNFKNIMKKIKQERESTPLEDRVPRSKTSTAKTEKASTKNNTSSRSTKSTKSTTTRNKKKKSDDFVVNSDEEEAVYSEPEVVAPRSTRKTNATSSRRSTKKVSKQDIVISDSDAEMVDDGDDDNDDGDYIQPTSRHQESIVIPSDEDEDDDLEEVIERTPSPPRPTRGKGSRGGRGAKATTSRTSGAKKKKEPTKKAPELTARDAIADLLARKRK